MFWRRYKGGNDMKYAFWAEIDRPRDEVVKPFDNRDNLKKL